MAGGGQLPVVQHGLAVLKAGQAHGARLITDIPPGVELLAGVDPSLPTAELLAVHNHSESCPSITLE